MSPIQHLLPIRWALGAFTRRMSPRGRPTACLVVRTRTYTATSSTRARVLSRGCGRFSATTVPHTTRFVRRCVTSSTEKSDQRATGACVRALFHRRRRHHDGHVHARSGAQHSRTDEQRTHADLQRRAWTRAYEAREVPPPTAPHAFVG